MDLKEQFENMKEILNELIRNDYENFVKALISIEKGVDDINILDDIYDEYMENDATGFLSEGIDDMISEYTDREELRDLEEKELEENEIEETEAIDENKKTDIKNDKNKDAKNLNGYMATNVEIKTLKNRDGKKFKAANFVVAQNDDMGNAHYTNCTAYNEKIDKVKNFKKGDFVHIFGKEKINIGDNDKEYKNLSVLSAKLLKEKKIYKDNDKTKNKQKSKTSKIENTGKKKTSTLGKLDKYKEKAKSLASNSARKSKQQER